MAPPTGPSATVVKEYKEIAEIKYPEELDKAKKAIEDINIQSLELQRALDVVAKEDEMVSRNMLNMAKESYEKMKTLLSDARNWESETKFLLAKINNRVKSSIEQFGYYHEEAIITTTRDNKWIQEIESPIQTAKLTLETKHKEILKFEMDWEDQEQVRINNRLQHHVDMAPRGATNIGKFIPIDSLSPGKLQIKTTHYNVTKWIERFKMYLRSGTPLGAMPASSIGYSFLVSLMEDKLRTILGDKIDIGENIDENLKAIDRYFAINEPTFKRVEALICYKQDNITSITECMSKIRTLIDSSELGKMSPNKLFKIFVYNSVTNKTLRARLGQKYDKLIEENISSEQFIDEIEKENRHLFISDPGYRDQGVTVNKSNVGNIKTIGNIEKKNMSCFCCGEMGHNSKSCTVDKTNLSCKFGVKEPCKGPPHSTEGHIRFNEFVKTKANKNQKKMPPKRKSGKPKGINNLEEAESEDDEEAPMTRTQMIDAIEKSITTKMEENTDETEDIGKGRITSVLGSKRCSRVREKLKKWFSKHKKVDKPLEKPIPHIPPKIPKPTIEDISLKEAKEKIILALQNEIAKSNKAIITFRGKNKTKKHRLSLIDSGATCCCLSLKGLISLGFKIKDLNNKNLPTLFDAQGNKLKVLGAINILSTCECRRHNGGKSLLVKFFVIKDLNLDFIMGFNEAQKMGILTLNCKEINTDNTDGNTNYTNPKNPNTSAH